MVDGRLDKKNEPKVSFWLVFLIRCFYRFLAFASK